MNNENTWNNEKDKNYEHYINNDITYRNNENPKFLENYINIYNKLNDCNNKDNNNDKQVYNNYTDNIKAVKNVTKELPIPQDLPKVAKVIRRYNLFLNHNFWIFLANYFLDH